METLSFYDVSHDWLSEKQSSVKYLTFDKYEKIVDKHLMYFKDKNIDEINEQDVENFFHKKQEENLSNSMLRTIKQVLKSIFDYCHDKYQLTTLSLDNIKVKEESTSSEILTPSQKDLMNIYVFKNNNHIAIAILLSLYSGLRTGEICGLKKEDIDIKNNTIYIHKTVERIKSDNDNKSELALTDTRTASRKIPLSQFVKHYLLKYFQTYDINSQDFLISQSDKLYDPRLLQRNLRDMSSSLHVKVDFRMLRNSFISYCLQNNMNIKCLCETIGTNDFGYIYKLCPECGENRKKEEMNRVLNMISE